MEQAMDLYLEFIEYKYPEPGAQAQHYKQLLRDIVRGTWQYQVDNNSEEFKTWRVNREAAGSQ